MSYLNVVKFIETQSRMLPGDCGAEEYEEVIHGYRV